MTLGYVICHYMLKEGGLIDDNSSIYLCNGCYKECGEFNNEILKSLRKDFGQCSYSFWNAHLSLSESLHQMGNPDLPPLRKESDGGILSFICEPII